MSPSPRHVPQPMAGRCSHGSGAALHAFTCLDCRDLSHITQKRGIAGDWHAWSLWVFLFPFILPGFSPPCCFCTLCGQPAAAAPRCGGKPPSTPRRAGPHTLTPRTPGGCNRRERGPKQLGWPESHCLPPAPPAPWLSLGGGGEPASIFAPLQTAALPSGAGHRDTAAVGEAP